MKYGYTIIYVADVKATLAFYETAFGFETRFLHETSDTEQYGELDTGDTVLAFASFPVADANLPLGYTKLCDMTQPAGFEIAVVTDDVPAAVQSAVNAGAALVAEPKNKPWGQTVAYVRGPDGVLIEICTPIAA